MHNQWQGTAQMTKWIMKRKMIKTDKNNNLSIIKLNSKVHANSFQTTYGMLYPLLLKIFRLQENQYMKTIKAEKSQKHLTQKRYISTDSQGKKYYFLLNVLAIYCIANMIRTHILNFKNKDSLKNTHKWRSSGIASNVPA